MPFHSLRRALLALALTVPLSAAHPAEPGPSAPVAEGFAAAFAAFGAPEVADVIPHTQPGADEAGEALGRALGGGSASYYAARFDGRRTASGETFDNDDFTAAHRTLPFGSKLRVTNPATGQSVVVRVNDRGPFHKGRLIDVSHAAAQRLGLIARGHGRVELALLD